MALHFAEGSVHTIQCKNAYMGYLICNGMNGDEVCKEMPNEDLVYTGHYIDHELVSNIEADCDARMARKAKGVPMRFLLTIGGAGAQKEIFGSHYQISASDDQGQQGSPLCQCRRLQECLG